MQKVVNISLAGIAYQLEEPGYNRLSDYLERAEARLADSPDRAEVMSDLEQAIGEKCARSLGPHKTVVSAAEIERIIEEMGPVESTQEKSADAPTDSTFGAGAAAATPPPPPLKRLYNIREGHMLGGVCNGLAAYLHVDVTWVRIAFLLLTLFTSGAMLLVYLALVIIVPYANTAEERAAAFGAPFSTQEFLDRAKKNFEKFGGDKRWRREWRRQQRNWNRQFRAMNDQIRNAAHNAASQAHPAATAIGALFVPIAAVVGALLFVGWILALISLVTQHSIFGWGLPHGMPMWIGVVLLVLAYVVVGSVLKAIRAGGQRAAGLHPGWAVLHTVVWICCAMLFFWAAYHFLPGIRELVDQVTWAANLTASTLSDTIH